MLQNHAYIAAPAVRRLCEAHMDLRMILSKDARDENPSILMPTDHLIAESAHRLEDDIFRLMQGLPKDLLEELVPYVAMTHSPEACWTAARADKGTPCQSHQGPGLLHPEPGGSRLSG